MPSTIAATPDWTAHFQRRADHMLAELRDLVEIESPSADPVAIRRVSEHFAREFAAIGGRVEVTETSAYGPNLVARFGAADQPVLLVGHLDTVWPIGTLLRLPWRTENGHAFGPGVFDMKSGCLVVLEALRALAGLADHPPVTVVFNCDEEIGSRTSRDLIGHEARRSRAVLVFEPAIPGGAAKTSRSGMAGYRIRLKGRAAHAGVDPEKGLSAIEAGAELVRRLHALKDLENGLSVNVGLFRGGTRRNVIAAEAELDVDVRFRSHQQGLDVHQQIMGLSTPTEGVELSIEGGIDRPPLEPTPANDLLYTRARAAAALAGIDLGQGHVGGVSDGNFTAAAGVPTLDGLGPDGCGAHADHEHIVIEDLPRRADLLTRLLIDLTTPGQSA